MKKQNEQHNSPKPVETPQLGVFGVVGSIFKIGDRVTRNSKHPHYKRYDGMYGTIIEISEWNNFFRYKIKWDKKAGKWDCGYRNFNPEIGQQHSTVQEKWLSF